MLENYKKVHLARIYPSRASWAKITGISIYDLSSDLKLEIYLVKFTSVEEHSGTVPKERAKGKSREAY